VESISHHVYPSVVPGAMWASSQHETLGTHDYDAVVGSFLHFVQIDRDSQVVS
jgi:hypothetical protein